MTKEDMPVEVPTDSSRDDLSAISAHSYQEYLQLLQDLSLTVLNQLDEQEVLKALMERATQWLGIPRAELYLVDEGRNVLESRVFLRDGVLEERRGHLQQRGEGLAGLAWTTGQPQVVHDYFNWSGYVSTYKGQHTDPITGKVPNISVISVPFKVRDVVIGVLDLVSEDAERKTGPAELSLLKRLMALASIALENARLYRQANQDSAAKSAFLARMSHELRTPLSTIIGYAEMLKEDMEDAGITTFLDDVDSIHVSGKYLLSLINQLLDLSKIEAGMMTCDWADVDTSAFFAELSNDVSTLCATNENQFQLVVEPGLLSLWTDRLKLRQILLNLLSNAAKFTQRGVIRLVVKRLPTDDGAEWIQFSVEDNGIGMDQADLRTLFDTYTRGKQKQQRKVAGTGLGMAISKELCLLLGGTIQAESSPGQGTTLQFNLPNVSAVS